ncbi:MAG: GFA family protein [Pseudomonadota bacterium]
MSPTGEKTGCCWCGAIAYVINGPLGDTALCHCSSCRLATGAPAVAWTTVDAAALKTVAGVPTERETSPGVMRSHCARCGTHLFYRRTAEPTTVDVTTVTLDHPPPISAHIWVRQKVAWLALDDGLPAFETDRSDGDTDSTAGD